MAFSTSTEMFQNIFMTSSPDEDMTEEFFNAVLRYLEPRSEIEEAAKLYEWVRAGHPMHGFLCRQDLVRDMADKMIVESIPFLCITEPLGDVGFLIRSCDNEAAEPVKRNVLDNRAKFCKVVTSEELKKDVLQSKESDKNIIFISNLSYEQIEILRQLCEENLDEDEIGIDEMNDGTYTFSFLGKRSMPGKKLNAMALNQVFIILMMESLGLNANINQRIARNKYNFDRAFVNGFKKKNADLRISPAWVVGRGPHYMRLDGNGFEYGVAVDGDDGNIELQEQYVVDASSPDYQAQLNSYIARIEDRTVTYDMRQAVRHLSGKEAGLNYSKSRDERIVSLFEKEIAKKADEIVMDKIYSDPVMMMDGHWDEKFTHYMREVASLIDGARMDKVPEGYTRKQIEAIQEISKTRKISLEAYIPAISGIRHIETALIEARMPQVKDISKHIERASEHTGRQGREQGSLERRSGGPKRE